MDSNPGAALYDTIGVGYRESRQPDPRIARRIHELLHDAVSVLNVGAGAGSYEPSDRMVIAVEPSEEMIRQRPAESGPAVQGIAASLPFPARAFDAAMAILTVHHWPSAAEGLHELRRVTKGPIVILTFDAAVHNRQWITDYLPEMRTQDLDLPTPEQVAEILGSATISALDVPHDCTDGFCHAYWRRPEAYLQPTVRAAISSFSRLPEPVVDRAMRKLDDDLRSRRWHELHADLLDEAEHDGGYRLVATT